MRKKLYEYGLIINESRIHIKSDDEKAIFEAVKEIKRHREELVNYVKEYPEFQYALKPLKGLPEAPTVVKIMAAASEIAGVGPMAAVAGALADIGLKALLRNGAETALVEDGGEIAAFVNRPLSVSILSADQDVSGKFGLLITREECPIGIATSSGKTGHAVSFGEADSVTVVADNAALADAAATAVCNSVIGVDIEKSVQLGIERSKAIKGVRGIIITREGYTGVTGKLPRIIKIKEQL
ncbi:MAG: UPF0280 family protein [Candidatus Bathyarchaeia archaeon]